MNRGRYVKKLNYKLQYNTGAKAGVNVTRAVVPEVTVRRNSAELDGRARKVDRK